MKTKSSRFRPSRRAWTVIVALSTLALAYPLAANALLTFGGVQKIFEGTDTVKVDFRRAWSFWPGRVHVRDIRVTMQDRNVQFVLEIPEVDVNIRLRDLLHRTFHATRVRGSGVSFRFRHRIDLESARRPSVGAFPPIPGFSDPPLREAGPPTPPIDDAHYKLWTVHIDDVDVGVRELWAQMFRFEGEGRVVGAFRLRPAKRLWVGPAELRLVRGAVTTGPHEVASSFEGVITCKVDDFDVEPVHGMDVFRFISARARLHSESPGLEAVNFLAGPDADFEVTEGSGALELDAAIDHGVFTEDSRAAYRAGHVGVDIGVAKFRLDGDLQASATGPTQGSGPEVALDIPAAKLSFDRAKHPPIDLRNVHASMAGASGDVTIPFEFGGARGALEAAFPDLGSLGDLPTGRQPIAVKRGRGEGRASFEMSADRKVRGSVDLDARRIRVCGENGFCSETPNLELKGTIASGPSGAIDGRFRLDADDLSVDSGTTQIAVGSVSARANVAPAGIVGSVDLKSLRAGAANTCPWIEAGNGMFQFRVQTPRQGPATASVDGLIHDASFTWGAFHAAVKRTGVTGSWDGERSTAQISSTALKLVNSGGPPKGWLADIGALTLRTTLDLSKEGVEGPVRVDVQKLSGQVGRTHLAGNLVAQLALRSRDATHRTAEVSGVVQARDVALQSNTGSVANWWADLDARKVELDTRQNLDLAGKVDVRFRDALPVLHLLASTQQVPQWTPQILPLRGLGVEFYVERYCRWTDIQVVQATGGPLKAAGRVQVQPGDTRGAILLQLAAFEPLAVGLNFDENESNASVFAGRGWLEEHLIPLSNAATVKHGATCVPEPPTCD